MYINKKGFSLVEVMVAIGMIGAISLVSLKIVEEQKGNESFLKFNNEVNKTVSLVINALNDKTRCQQMLGGVVRNTDMAALRTLKGTEQINLLVANTNYSDFRIPTGGIRVEQSTANNQITDLVLTFHVKNRNIEQRKNVSVSGGQVVDNDPHVIIKRIPFIAVLETSNNSVRSCGPVIADANASSLEKLCLSLNEGGTGNNFTWSGGRCLINHWRCHHPNIPVAMNKAGVLECDDIRNQVNLSDFISTSGHDCRNEQIDIGVNGGRLSVSCPDSNRVCNDGPITWRSPRNSEAGYNECVSSLPVPTGTNRSDLRTRNVSDVSGPTTGTATFNCNEPNWILDTSSATCLSTCPAESKSWTQNGQTCSTTIGSRPHAASETITDNSYNTYGSATFSCDGPTWVIHPGSTTCSLGCRAEGVSWSNGGNSCSGNVSHRLDGQSDSTSNTGNANIGSATFNCVGDNWVVAAGATCEPPPPPVVDVCTCEVQSCNTGTCDTCTIPGNAEVIAGVTDAGSCNALAGQCSGFGSYSTYNNNCTWGPPGGGTSGGTSGGTTGGGSNACRGSGPSMPNQYQCICTANGALCGPDYTCCGYMGCTGNGTNTACP